MSKNWQEANDAANVVSAGVNLLKFLRGDGAPKKCSSEAREIIVESPCLSSDQKNRILKEMNCGKGQLLKKG